MKHILWVMVLLVSSHVRANNFGATIAEVQSQSTQAIRVMTFNFQSAYTGISDTFMRKEIFRIDMASDMFRQLNPDIICLQEPHLYDMESFEENLKEYAWFGEQIERPASKTYFKTKAYIDSSDINAIMYKKNKFNLLDSGTFWINETRTPYKAGWTAKSMRTCVWGKFQDVVTQKIFLIFNTHLDHKSHEARIKGAELIIDVMKEKTENGKLPALIVGDFNLEEGQIRRFISAPFNLVNAKSIAVNHQGPRATYIDGKIIIDHILLNSATAFHVDQYAVIDYQKNDTTPSDHRAVVVDVTIK